MVAFILKVKVQKLPSNFQASDFHNQLARLQSLLERSEAERQQLEYSLALANQSSRQSEDAAEEKEREFRSIQDSLQSKTAV